MAERRESRLRATFLAGTIAAGLASLAPHARAQESENNFALGNSGIGDYMEATHPDLGDDGHRPQFERRGERIDFTEQVEEGLGDYIQNDLLRRRFGIRTPGTLRVTDDRVRGDGVRFVVELPFPLSQHTRRNRSVFDPYANRE